MTFYTAVLGTFAFYGPKAGREVFNIQPERADLTFGAITVLTGGHCCALPGSPCQCSPCHRSKPPVSPIALVSRTLVLLQSSQLKALLTLVWLAVLLACLAYRLSVYLLVA